MSTNTKWIALESQEQLEEIRKKSFTIPQLIFKHSTRCSISAIALHRMEMKIEDIDYYLLDLLQFRELSHRIAETFGVYHESPQILLIRDGECQYEESHLAIHPEEIQRELYS